MCVYNGVRVSRAEFIRLKDMERALKNLVVKELPVQYGYDYGEWPIVRPTLGRTGIDVVMAHWELLPPWLLDGNSMKDFRMKYNTLNAKGETLLTSPMFKLPAKRGRCLVISTGFFEFRHVHRLGKSGQPLKTPDKYPYHVTVKGQEYFYMAGISNQWIDRESGEVYDTFSIVTTEANPLMAQVHNSKGRMPTILPEEQAHEWLFGELTDKQVTELATYKVPSEQLQAVPVRKDFRMSLQPEEAAVYPELPALV